MEDPKNALPLGNPFEGMTLDTIQKDELLRDVKATCKSDGNGGYTIDVTIPKLEMTAGIPKDVMEHNQTNAIPKMVEERLQLDLAELAATVRVLLRFAIQDMNKTVAEAGSVEKAFAVPVEEGVTQPT